LSAPLSEDVYIDISTPALSFWAMRKGPTSDWRRRFITGLVMLTAMVSFAAAEPVLPPGLVAQGWEEITFDGKQRNRYAACGTGCVSIETDASVSMIGRPAATDLSRSPVLSWEWKIDRPVTASDLSTEGKDDRAVAVYVTFPYDPATATFTEKLLRPVIELARGEDAPSRVISYVWGGYGKPGDIVRSPFFGGVNALVICRNANAPVGSWVAESFDVVADHERIFGHAPAAIQHVLLSADSDDTKSPNRAHVRKIRFAPK